MVKTDKNRFSNDHGVLYSKVPLYKSKNGNKMSGGIT